MRDNNAPLHPANLVLSASLVLFVDSIKIKPYCSLRDPALSYRYFVAVGKRAPSRRKRAYFTAEFMSIYGDRARVLRPFLACISLLNKVPIGEAENSSLTLEPRCALAARIA